jgi:tetratricopeptide (TPR) repeat protein
MRKIIGSVFVAGALVAGGFVPAFANESNGYQQISAGNYAAAEREIAEQRRLFPHDADLLINLGTIYARTGRVAEARALFRDVLTRENEELTLSQAGSGWSHSIAKNALARLEPVVASIR